MTKTIPLTRGKVALVDDEDFEHLNQWKWCAQKMMNKWYATRSTRTILGRKAILMHRAVASAPRGMYVDHINGDSLDNRRTNLRICTNAENAMNRGKQTNNASGYKGVFWSKDKKKYVAQIKINGVRTHLGYFHTSKEAALAYDAAAKKHFGKFAHLNFP